LHVRGTPDGAAQGGRQVKKLGLFLWDFLPGIGCLIWAWRMFVGKADRFDLFLAGAVVGLVGLKWVAMSFLRFRNRGSN
jgi:hypothetical protein